MKFIVALVLTFVALTAPLPAQAPNASPPPKLEVPYTQFTLANGLNVILHEDHTVPVVSVNVHYLVGSARERAGRTGFAHLYEHLMFMGSGHVGPGQFDGLLADVGGTNNGSTTNDRTNYWINVPSNALDLALFLESDRMGFLMESMTPKSVDIQRDVVKNERRQRVENTPYGNAGIVLEEMLYPANHPYHWPVIGYMDDLTAASYEDVVHFHETYYAPSNASLVVAGDIDPVATRTLVEKWFTDVKPGTSVAPMDVPGVSLTGVQKRSITDRVQLPRLYVSWLTPPIYAPGDAALDIVAAVLTGGKNSRLHKRLVYDLQMVQSIDAYQYSRALSSYFTVEVAPRPGQSLEKILPIIDEEIARLQREGPTAYEVQRAINQIEASFLGRMERVGGFGGKADQLNSYYSTARNPDWFEEDLARYRALSPADVHAAARAHLPSGARVELTVVPE